MRPGQCRTCREIDVSLNGWEGCRARQVSRTAASIGPFGLLVIVALDFDAGTTEVTGDGEGCHSRMGAGYGVWYMVYGRGRVGHCAYGKAKKRWTGEGTALFA